MAISGLTLSEQGAGGVSANAMQSQADAMGNLNIDQITEGDVVTENVGYPPANVILVFTQFALGDVITDNVYASTKGLWSNSSASLNTYYTASELTDTQKDYYLKINSSTSSCDDSTEFYIAYGNRQGFASVEAEGQANDTPTRAIYKQYRQLLLTPEDEQFSFKSGSTFIPSDSIYVINFNSKLIGDKVDPGNFELSLAKLDGNLYPSGEYTSSVAIKVDSGSSKVISLIDDSLDYIDVAPSLTATTRVFNIVSGSIENGIATGENEAYGLFYADYGVLVLNANKLNSELAMNVTTGSYVAGNNNIKLLTAISGAAMPTNTRIETSSFFARKVDIKTNSYYYVRLRNYQYNYSTNPTYYTGSRAELVHRDFTYNPVSYITSIGLYNRNYELLAVAKMSKPLKKTFFDEYLITIKLEY
jgi:acetyltransferase-like isoleucine patch superfamily enzyme